MKNPSASFALGSFKGALRGARCSRVSPVRKGCTNRFLMSAGKRLFPLKIKTHLLHCCNKCGDQRIRSHHELRSPPSMKMCFELVVVCAQRQWKATAKEAILSPVAVYEVTGVFTGYSCQTTDQLRKSAPENTSHCIPCESSK